MGVHSAALPMVAGEVAVQGKKRAGAAAVSYPLMQAATEYVSHALPSLLDRKREEATERWMQVYLEDFVEQEGIPAQLLREAEMVARSKARIVKSEQFWPAAKIMQLTGSTAGNTSATPNRWKKQGLTYAIRMDSEGTDLFPLYSLDPEEGYRPRKAMKDILREFKEKTPWRIAFWFESPNSYLRNRKPREVLCGAPERVIEAARIEAEGVVHG